jgi:hypothetical protein
MDDSRLVVKLPLGYRPHIGHVRTLSHGGKRVVPRPCFEATFGGRGCFGLYVRAMAMQSSRNVPALLVSRTRSNAVSRALISSMSLIWGSSVSM